MAVQETGTTPTCRPLSARTPAGAPCIVLLAKRTYSLDADEAVPVPAPEQRPLRASPVFEGDEPTGLMHADSDAWPYKLRTDIVVHGHVYAYGTHGQASAAVMVGATRKRFLVSGDRRCARSTDGRVLFSDPEPFERMPLGYDRAYGGYDQGAEAALPNLFKWIGASLPAGTDPEMYSLACYPRNRHGRGYYLAGSTTPLDDVLLPNIEDPSDLLDPDRLIVTDPFAWWRQPVPTGTSWLHPGYFARCAYMGVRPFWKPLPDELPELTRGYLPEAVRRVDVLGGDPCVLGIQNGASLGLQLSDIRSGDGIRLLGMHPKQRELDVEIPPPPKMTIHTRWRKPETAPTILHHIELFPDDDLFTVVWRGAVDAGRALLPEELDALPVTVEWRR